jgi:hypothetical protein
VVDEINYLRVTLKNTGGCSEQKARLTADGSQSVVDTGKCLAKTVDIKAEILENVYEMITESKVMCGVEVWGSEKK